MRHDMTAYFDAVLDENMRPLFNGSAEEVLGWLEARPSLEKKVRVCIGRDEKTVTVEEYLQQFS